MGFRPELFEGYPKDSFTGHEQAAFGKTDRCGTSPGRYFHYGTPNQQELDRLSISEAKKYLEEGQFPAGSMGPKIQAVINFLESGGERAIISSIDKIKEALEGKAGTQIYKNN